MTYDGENRPPPRHPSRKTYLIFLRRRWRAAVQGGKPSPHARHHHHSRHSPRHCVFHLDGGAKLENRRGGAGDHLPASECQSHQRRQTYLHRDALGHVRAMTDAAGVKIEPAIYKTFGEQTEAVCHATRPRNQGLDRRTLRRRRRPAIFERAVLLSDTGHVYPAGLV